jgi:AcrR family transcriptional regulator
METKEYIIDQAYCLFLNHSYEAVSISEISKAIGFTKGALYHHFKNKEDLFKAVIDKYLDLRIVGVNETKISLVEYIDRVIEHAKIVFKNILADKHGTSTLNYLALYIDAFRHYPRFTVEKGDFIQDEIMKLEGIIRNAVERGEVRKDINVKIIATNIFSLSIGLIVDLLFSNSTEQAIDTLHDQLLEFYKLIKL